jgi:3-hydroxyacyl-[acyl-carrier-protein] dehydratase
VIATLSQECDVAGKELIIDFSEYDLDHVIADAEEVRRYNPQRFEMEQLTAVVYEDAVKMRCVGYKDVTEREFWVRGHMPQFALMPGVIICEAAAQLMSYFVLKYDLVGAKMLGFGGLTDVQFRGMVRPGDRLVIAAALTKVRRGAMIVSEFQAFVRQTLVCNGTIKGVPLPVEAFTGA